jgi:anti-anti-sigma factor
VNPPATLDSERHGDNIVVSVAGEIDVFNAGSVAAEIEAAVPTEVHGAVLDLTAVGFLDSTAIRKLFALTGRLRERRQRVLIVTPAGSIVLRTLQLVEFGRAAPLHETVQDALAELGARDGAAPA